MGIDTGDIIKVENTNLVSVKKDLLKAQVVPIDLLKKKYTEILAQRSVVLRNLKDLQKSYEILCEEMNIIEKILLAKQLSEVD